MNKLITKLQKSLAAFLVFVFALVFTTITYAADAPSAGNAVEGQKLFKANCATCHSIGKGKITGPDLAGVTGRVPSPYQDWMFKWIKNNAALRKSGDAYANKVYADNNGVAMTVFDGALTDDQIKNIIAYVANPPAEVAQTSGGGSSTTGAAKTENTESYGWVLLLVIGVLLIIITVLRTVRRSLLAVSNEKKGIPAPEELGFWKGTVKWIKTHKVQFAVINIFLTAVFCVYGWEYLWGIDVTPGYHPSQPINFRHDVHAGQNGIACIYCHSGAEKGKVAGIPTLNVCMNCHKGIQGSNDEFKKEIAKIYYAVGWDPQAAAYTKSQHPVQWNRVHSLPDFAYFNHSQHVVVGKIECQKCHGDCATYTTNQQFAPLTMGWCIDCHRATPVQMQGNGYYAKLHEALMKQDTSRAVTEGDMGGLECGKCHY
ncbi:MAG TPA: c-type cytochrome [Bacteroidia bacterium]|jgi:cytochrome c2|nr:c-type cytochrome [Bacteroidia bacterium]